MLKIKIISKQIYYLYENPVASLGVGAYNDDCYINRL